MAIVLFSCGEEASGVVGDKVIMEVCSDNVLSVYHEKVIIFVFKY